MKYQEDFMLATAKGHFNGSRIVFDTPVDFQQGQEVVVTYMVIPQSMEEMESNESLVDSLVGAIPNTGKTLAEYRSERLKKYASAD